jgi:hypothetical protein
MRKTGAFYTWAGFIVHLKYFIDNAIKIPLQFGLRFMGEK